MTNLTRRGVLKAGFGAGLAATAAPLMVHGAATAQPTQKLIAEAPFARLEEIGDGLYAVVSTPLDKDGRIAHVQTLCNGGLIVGDDAILAIDAFYQPAGAAWLNTEAKRLFGRPVSHVLCTHLHLDHTGGLAGFQDGADGPEIIMTATTWRLMVDKYSLGRVIEGSPFLRPPAKLVGPTQVISDETAAIPMDLGGRSVTIQPLAGHTPSDLAVLVDDAPVTYGGDLAWWGLFPNYVDAVPSALGPSVAALMAGSERLMVTGHGGLVSTADMGPYAVLIDSVAVAAEQARDKGQTPQEAGASYAMPKETEGWAFFNPRYPEIAITAWFREWERAEKAMKAKG